MNKFKILLLSAVTLLTMILIVPTLLVLPFSNKEDVTVDMQPQEEVTIKEEKEQPKLNPIDSQLDIAVYRSEKNKIEQLPLEAYVAGVVAAEMPAEFEIEALKAQALSARTYIVKLLMSDADLNLPDGAMVTDTILHQVYRGPAELKEMWGPEYDWKINRIQEAVNATKGQILTYNEEPITAAFFSTSNGFTENSEDYWPNEFPYLRSVESPWDTESPKFYDEKEVTITQLERLLNVTIPEEDIGQILSRTEGNRVDEVKIGNKTFNGREIREALNLQSSDFTFERQGNSIVFKTKGYGHGVGMSQYGANGMAQHGRLVDDIVTHYFKGVTITPITPYENKLLAKN